MRPDHKIFEKLANEREKLEFGSQKSSKRALVSYVQFPQFALKSTYFRSAHVNKAFSKMIVDTLLSFGYSVTLTRCDRIPEIKGNYDLFLGHTKTFSEIASLLPKECIKILLLTGSSPEFGNRQQKLRSEALRTRRAIAIPEFSENVVPDASENLNVADSILLVGNDFTKYTWHADFHSKMFTIDNFSMFPRSTKIIENHNYLFLSSVGQVHRGLDLVLEAFSGREENLFICSGFEKEPEFKNAFHNELYRSSNVHPVGWVNLAGRKFSSIAQMCSFAILPTCSEGMSSSLLNLMALGLIPVATRNAGVDLSGHIGEYIEFEVSDILRVLDSNKMLSSLSIAQKRSSLRTLLDNRYTYESVSANLMQFFLRYS